ncbi:hypothetical protein ScPMuIL_005451 [Solemya velum]
MANIYDYVRAVALVVGFLAVLWRDRKVWMKVDACVCMFYVVALIVFPGKYIRMQTTITTPDEFHIFIAQNVGFMLLSVVMLWYLLGNSRDETFVGAFLIGRIVALAICDVTIIYGYLQYDKLSDKGLWFDLLGLVLHLITAIVQYVRTRPVMGRREPKGAVTVIMHIQFLLQIFSGLFLLAFPKMFFKPLKNVPIDEVHMQYTRIIGAMALGFGFMTWYSPAFRSNEDKISFNIVGCLLPVIEVAVVGLSFLTGCLTNMEIWKMMSVQITMILPLLVVVLLKRAEKGHDSVDRVTTGGYYTRSKSN